MERFDLSIESARRLWQKHVGDPSLAPKGVVESPAFRAALAGSPSGSPSGSLKEEKK